MRRVFVMLRHGETLQHKLSAPSPVRLPIIKQEVQIGLIPARAVIRALLREHTEWMFFLGGGVCVFGTIS